MSTHEPGSTSERLGGDRPVRVTTRSTATGGGGGSRAGASGGPMDLLRLSELIVFLVLTIAILIAAAAADGFGASKAWTLVAGLGAAFIISRGLAKLGRQHEDDVL